MQQIFVHLRIPDSVDLRTKRRAFDLVMSVRRLEEEKIIVVTEMNQHWKALCNQANSLREMSSQLSNEAASKYLTFAFAFTAKLQYITTVSNKGSSFLRVR